MESLPRTGTEEVELTQSFELSYIVEPDEINFNCISPIWYHPKYDILGKLEGQPTLVSMLKEPQTIDTGICVSEYSKKQDIGYLRVGDIKPYKPRYSKITHVDKQILEENNLPLLNENDVLVSRVGTVGVVSLFYDAPVPCTFSDNVFRLTFANGVNSRYVVAFLNTKYGLLQIERIIKGTLQGVINTTTLSALRIFIPKEPERTEQIANEVFEAYETANRIARESDELEGSLDSQIQKKLGIEIEQQSNQMTFFVDAKNIAERYDPKFYHPDHIKLQEGVFGESKTKLDQLCAFPERPIGKQIRPDQTILYVDISSVDAKKGEITKPKRIVFKDAPSRAQQIIHENDILVSLTRPTRNAIVMVPRELDGQVCSTGFSVLCANENIDPSFLLTLLRTNVIRLQIQFRTRGSMYPAISPSDLKELSVPFTITDLEVQKQIAKEIKSIIIAIDEKRKMANKILYDARENAENMITQLLKQ